MPEYTLRNVDPELWSQFVNRAKQEGWPIRALIVALLEEYARGTFTLPVPPPRELPEYGWLRAHFRAAAKNPDFLMLPTPLQWEALVDQVVKSEAGASWRDVDQVPPEKRGDILRWLEKTSNLPLREGLTLHAIGFVGDGPDLSVNRRVFQYKVLGLPAGHEAWIANATGSGWEILRAFKGKMSGTGWSRPYRTKEEALSILAETVEPHEEDETAGT